MFSPSSLDRRANPGGFFVCPEGRWPNVSFGGEGLCLCHAWRSVKQSATVKQFAERQLRFPKTESANSECSKFPKKQENLSLMLVAAHLHSLGSAMRRGTVFRLAPAGLFILM
jgi:hypothetical protein